MKNTPIYGFNQPEYTDSADIIPAVNENMNIAEGALSGIRGDLDNGVYNARGYYVNPYKNRVEIKTSQTWTVPAGVNKIGLFLVGGGAPAGSSGTGGGGYCTFIPEANVQPGAQLDIIIGAGASGSNTGGETSISNIAGALARGGGYYRTVDGERINGGSGGVYDEGGTVQLLGGRNGGPGSMFTTGSGRKQTGQGQGNTTDPFSGIMYAKGGDRWSTSAWGIPPGDVAPVDNTGNGGSRILDPTAVSYPGSSGIAVIYY